MIIEGWHAKPERRKPWDTTLEQDLGISREGLRLALFSPPKPGAEPRISACARGETDLKDTLAVLLPDLGYAGSIDAFVGYWFRKDSNLNQDVLDIVKSLGQCEDVELYLATSQEHHRAAYLWNDLGLKNLFDDIFYSARLGALKDNTDFFARINAQLEIASSERPLFFDDTDEVVATARKAGWDAHVFDRIEDLAQNPRLRRVLGTENT